MSQATSVSVPVTNLCHISRTLPYFSDWSAPELKSVVSGCRTLQMSAPQRIIQVNGMEPFAYFLVKGEVTVEMPTGEIRTIREGDPDAGYPIANLRPSPYSVTAAAGAILLRIEASKLRSHQASRKPASLFTDDEVAGLDWIDHPLVTRLIKQARNGTLSLPAMPGIALRVRKSLERDDYRLNEIVAIISADPAIVARLLNIANSALFRGCRPCESVRTGLQRLGVNKTLQIVMSLAARDLFVVKDANLKKLMLQRWRHAIDIAALCAVLARHTQGLQSENALLAGLLHEIGALPLLRSVSSYPDLLAQPEVLQDMLDRLTPELTAMSLHQWGFEDAFITAARHQNNWFRDHDGPADYTDVLLLAHLHALAGQRARLKLPRIDEIPAFQKLAAGQLTPQLSLGVLDEAKGQIQELKSLLA
ncbi:HDOD domain-containing protein [Ketobacter sp. MCCC 1A13808]|uniref:HDOD domain-containing protein n=1 Tax=Ketobacter sp. MCCC 1A13808 TaxID=2602738 RepID=UPI000F2740A9|nr:HDOD domain-containing protein [Ketobacter sp. MCCC 1A13808]MVF12175.1 HDOD domain-containing protein [Ketobacter sp. MCCC 1A13808]RLP53717.1 MAG: HDOD domain-containing protein [Ketobacter sp.]